MNLFGTKEIKVHVERVLHTRRQELDGRTVVDVPAGSGHSSRILQSLGAKVEALDLFPAFFNVEGLSCGYADLEDRLPLPDEHADYVLCQEGIEHMPDQLHLFAELNRVAKSGATLLMTTPNYGMLRARLSYLLGETEFYGKLMPPNELDSIWFADGRSEKVYHGHIFLLGIQKLRLLARLSGFRIRKIHHLRVNHTSLALLVLCYPFILLSNLAAYRRAMRKRPEVDVQRKRAVYRETLKLALDPRLLVDGHLCVEFEKVSTPAQAAAELRGKYADFDIQT